MIGMAASAKPTPSNLVRLLIPWKGQAWHPDERVRPDILMFDWAQRGEGDEMGKRRGELFGFGFFFGWEKPLDACAFGADKAGGAAVPEGEVEEGDPACCEKTFHFRKLIILAMRAGKLLIFNYNGLLIRNIPSFA